MTDPKDEKELKQGPGSAHPLKLPFEDVVGQKAICAQTGQRLAKKIFQLTNVDRTKDPQAYIAAVSVALGDHKSSECVLILQAAAKYFTDTYSEEIRGRGESPLLLDQIVHRIGKENRHLLNNLLEGFDPQVLARSLWQACLNKQIENWKAIKKRSQGLTVEQFAELQTEYALIPGYLLAEELHDLLNVKNFKGEPALDLAELCYLLGDKVKSEIQQIERCFRRLYCDREEKPEAPLAEQLLEKIPNEKETIVELLAGFDAEALAKRIQTALNNCEEPSQEGSPFGPVHPDFSGRLRRNYGRVAVWMKELKALTTIDNLFYPFSSVHFQAVNSLLETKYGLHLTPQLYQCNRPFHPRRVALALQNQLESIPPIEPLQDAENYLTAEEIEELTNQFPEQDAFSRAELKKAMESRALERRIPQCLACIRMLLLPLHGLTGFQLQEVSAHFLCLIGSDLNSSVQKRMLSLCRAEVPKPVSEYVRRRLGGRARNRFNPDLQEALTNPPQTALHALSSEDTEQLRQTVIYGQKLIERVSKDPEAVTWVESFFADRSFEQLTLLEAFFTEVIHTPLRAMLKKHLPEEFCASIELRFEDLVPAATAQKIHTSPETIFTLFDFEPALIIQIAECYKNEVGLTLGEAAAKAFGDMSQIKKRALAFLLTATDRVLQLEELLLSSSALDDDQQEALLRELGGDTLDVYTLEASYNFHLARVSPFHTASGGLLERLRLLATQEFISRPTFVRAVSLLEGLNPELVITLESLFAEAKPDAEALQRLRQIFRAKREDLYLINRLFAALRKGLTIREAVNTCDANILDRNRLLLLLDGFDPDAVATELYDAVSKLTGQALGEAVADLLEDPRSAGANPRIPEDTNWTGEMYHQIRMLYEAKYGTKLIHDLKEKEVPTKGPGILGITQKLYGDAVRNVFKLHELLESSGLSQARQSARQAELLDGLLKPNAQVLEKIVDLYDSYFGLASDSNLLQGRVAAVFKDSPELPRLLDAFKTAEEWHDILKPD